MSMSIATRRRWLSFTLSGLLAVVTAIALSLGWWINSARQQQAAVAAIYRVDSNPNIRYESDQDDTPQGGFGLSIRKARSPSIIEERLGRDYVDNVAVVAFGEGPSNGATDADRRYAFRKIANLRRLDQLVPYVEVRDEDVLSITQLPNLTRLEFGVACPQLTDESLRTLSRMSRLTSLTIRDAPISDQGILYLLSMTQMKCLVLGQADPHSYHASSFQITDEGLACLAALPNLEQIGFNVSRVTADGFRHLSSLSGLSMVRLEGASVGDEAILHFSQIANLRNVTLYHTRVTASGLEAFKASHHLQSVEVYPAASGDLARLKSVLPNCTLVIGGKTL